jgi:hypothetical protein
MSVFCNFVFMDITTQDTMVEMRLTRNCAAADTPPRLVYEAAQVSASVNLQLHLGCMCKLGLRQYFLCAPTLFSYSSILVQLK